ncbi:glycosyltransferase family 2 protein [Formosa sediminum]|uniref:Glycosyltransferase family 2 protein n=1 Tax=Formosa sediminum TaxID=2594004 RepID=A0A516GQ97_9FLAO|nr:glycosyltransferase family A protein [Formosa sediminum]QDO93682.1 glycosyltransferase family 2 protein [Formosa sediminum]
MNRNIAIVVVAYNRASSLNRVLSSLNNGNYLDIDTVDLIISCDFSGEDACSVLAKEFIWEFGNKKVIVHNENLGLRKHILFCGDLVSDYDGLVMLEDDLYVCPNFYNYIYQADTYFKNNKKIAQISLYTNEIEEFSYSRFMPLNQEADNFFMQVPSSWGQYWTKEQWFNFKEAYMSGELEITQSSLLPDWVINHWPESSWKKYFYNYIIKNDLYVVYPYKSLSTNFGDAGTHHKNQHSHNQSVLDYSISNFKFLDIEESKVIYDYNYELHKNLLNQFFEKDSFYDVEFDLNGMKDLSKISTKYLVSSKTCSKPIKTFGCHLLPQELNIKFHNKGDFYSLGLTVNFDPNIQIEKIYNRNLMYIPSITLNKLRNEIKSIYADSNSYKIGKKITSFFNPILGKFKNL